MNFVTIDVETANHNMASICQIGIAVYASGVLIDEWCTLIDPEDYFDGVNVSIHGIDSDMVRGAEKLPDIAGKLRELLERNVAVCHGHFDKNSIAKAFEKYGLTPIYAEWLDSLTVSRCAWPSLGGYALPNVCREIGYELTHHHDALEDAKAAGAILVAAMNESQQSIEYWLNRAKRGIYIPRSKVTKISTNPNGHLFGQILVFTGELGISRDVAADLAANAGCTVVKTVTKKTTILVVGRQDFRTRLAGHEKSTKFRRAEDLISLGSRIQVISESEFFALVKSAK
jgi:DNA polymerase-3 subunit epsilon